MNPRILLLDCNLEYKKGESQTNIEITQEADFSRLLQVSSIFGFNGSQVLTHKLSDLNIGASSFQAS